MRSIRTKMFSVFKALKIADGFDVLAEDGYYEGLYQDFKDLLTHVHSKVDSYDSVYEVGCGSGVNLFLFRELDGTCMELDEEDCITDFIPGKCLDFHEKDHYYKTVNIYKYSAQVSLNTYVPFLSAYQKAMGENEHYESVIKLITLLETREIGDKRLSGQIWYENDSIQDLNIAESLFADSDEEHYKQVSKRYGGFWRYPKRLDFCYLVNPYYPPKQMMGEMKSNFETLLTQYLSGVGVNDLDAAGSFGVELKNIVMGNAVAELIKSLNLKNIQTDLIRAG